MAPSLINPALPNFGPFLLWPNGYMDQDATWYGGIPRPRRLCVRWGPRSPPQKGGGGVPRSAQGTLSLLASNMG